MPWSEMPVDATEFRVEGRDEEVPFLKVENVTKGTLGVFLATRSHLDILKECMGGGNPLAAILPRSITDAELDNRGFSGCTRCDVEARSEAWRPCA